MNVLHFCSGMRLELGGVVRAVLDLCGALSQAGHSVTLITDDSRDVPHEWQDSSDGLPRVVDLSVKSIPVPHIPRSQTAEVESLIATAQVVHLHVPWDPVCLQIARMCRRVNRPYIVSIHGMLDDWTMALKTIKKRLYLASGGRKFLEQAAAVHCTAQVEADQSRKWYPNGRSIVIPLVFDLARFQTPPGKELAQQAFPDAFVGEPTVLFVGRIHPIKRIELLLKSAASIHNSNFQCQVLIAGEGDRKYQQRLEELVTEFQLSDRVHFLGFVTGDTKISLYQAADVFVLPSYHENWGFVSVESLACGTPVVTTRDVNIWQELKSSGGAEIVRANPTEIAQAITAIAGDKNRQRLMSQNARSWVFRYLDANEIVKQYETLYARRVAAP